MRRWTQLWYHLEGGPPRHYDEDFFDWWTHVTFCVNEYCYANMDYRGDLDLPLPMDAQWGTLVCFQFFFFVYMIFYGVQV